MTCIDTPMSTCSELLVSGYLKTSSYLERTTEALAATTAALQPADAVGAAAVQRAWRHLAAAVEHHQRTHDDVVWPAVAGQDPDADADALDAGHEQLRSDVRRVTAALGWLVSGWRDHRAGTPEAVGATRTLARHLREHLAEEERVVLPRLASLGGQEARELAERIQGCDRGADALAHAVAAGTLALRDLPLAVRLTARAVLVPRYERDMAALTGPPVAP